MNTVKSTWYGWGVLCVAGGGAYYFAKRSINADRSARYDAEMKKQARLRQLESQAAFSSDTPSKSKRQDAAQSGKGLDFAGDPSSEISEDVAPVGHAPMNAEQRVREKSKYEAAEPYRSRKGDRLG